MYASPPALVSSLPRLPHAPPLPIDAILPAVGEALASRGVAVVVAAPGAGKTTRLPLALLDAPWRAEGRILVLEPRRIAARAAAVQMATLLGERVGETVGYRVRHESRVGPRTRVEVLTEGILTRMLQDDPTLEGVAAVLFDEFHERHLPSDLGLALALESRAVLRDDLRVVVMSATLEAAPVARLLGGGAGEAPVIVSEGRSHAVSTDWRPLRDGLPFATAVAQSTRRALDEHAGDALVFLPGIAEIHRVRTALEDAGLAVEVQLLHGSLSLEEQSAVLRPATSQRRVILSTSIAESSVTLDGVRLVIDAGLSRVPRFDARSGMSRLETLRVSRASADQRRGRAGRTAPGHCLRLWDAATEAALSARSVPEILESDLAPLALELACAGIGDAARLAWLDAPPAGALAQARALLRSLGALDAPGGVTPHGRAMAALGIAPRLAHLVLRAAAHGVAPLGCEVAALLAERDVLRREAADGDADLQSRLDALRGGMSAAVDRGRLQRVRQEAKALERMLRQVPRTASEPLGLGALVALAYPDRIAKRREGEAARFLLRNGRGARLERPQALGDALYLAIADLDGNPAESRIWLAASLDEEELRAVAGAAITVTRVVTWDEARDQPVAVAREQLDAIVFRERPARDVADDEIARALAASVQRRGLDALPWRASDQALRARLAAAHAAAPERYPDVSDPELLHSLDDWLVPALGAIRRRADLSRVELGAALLARCDWRARAALEAFVPTHLEVPSGSRIAIDYSDPTQPVLAVKLQELFGMLETPRVADGRLPLTIHLLSPAGRPVQVTRDLASFWRAGYFEVRRDLKGRYPRHPWPDDPLSAAPTRRVKPRGT